MGRPIAPAPTGRRGTGRRGTGRFAGGYARAVVRLRWWVIVFWVVATLLSAVVLPGLGGAKGGDGLKGLLSTKTPAVATELRSLDAFGFPLIGRTVLVQRDPTGLSVYAQARTVNNAVAVDKHAYQVDPLLGALPVSNTLGLFPGANETNTTALTYLFFDPRISARRQTRAAQSYADHYFGTRDHVIGVTGSIPARAAQGHIISQHLRLVELSTLFAIMLLVGLAFRSVVAPVVSVAVTGVAYVMTLRLSGLLAGVIGISTPSELEPVVVAMLLGVVTDYVVFFFSALRNQLAITSSKDAAAVAATARFGPIVTVAGIAVAAGTAALSVAQSSFFKALGPALAFTVLVALVVAVTLVPAVMAVLGRFILWPTRDPRTQADDSLTSSGRPRASVRLSPATHLAHHRRLAGLVVAGCAGGLALAAVPLLHLQLGVSFVTALPSQTEVRRAATAAQDGFAPGILSPTVVLVEGHDITDQRDDLATLGDLLKNQPGVAGVVGPGDQPLRQSAGVLLARDGGAARYLVILDAPPLGATAIENVNQIQGRLPGLMTRSGLTNARGGIAGDTATASFIVDRTQADLARIAIAALLANLCLLLIFLRAVVAAVYLLGCSLLSVSATLGLTTLVFEHFAPGQGLTFYVPFAAAALLLAFGSDYNIFGVGHIWDAARRRPLTDAVVAVMPGTTRALVSAGLALAVSFGLLALVPLLPFRQLAFAMSLGILLDIFIVRLLLIPALVVLVGPASGWPSKRLRVAEYGPAWPWTTPDP